MLVIMSDMGGLILGVVQTIQMRFMKMIIFQYYAQQMHITKCHIKAIIQLNAFQVRIAIVR